MHLLLVKRAAHPLQRERERGFTSLTELPKVGMSTSRRLKTGDVNTFSSSIIASIDALNVLFKTQQFLG
jgi:hypothetical protein